MYDATECVSVCVFYMCVYYAVTQNLCADSDELFWAIDYNSDYNVLCFMAKSVLYIVLPHSTVIIIQYFHVAKDAKHYRTAVYCIA